MGSELEEPPTSTASQWKARVSPTSTRPVRSVHLAPLHSDRAALRVPSNTFAPRFVSPRRCADDCAHPEADRVHHREHREVPGRGLPKNDGDTALPASAQPGVSGYAGYFPDLLPTFCQIAGVEPSVLHDGVSLSPLLRSGEQPVTGISTSSSGARLRCEAAFRSICRTVMKRNTCTILSTIRTKIGIYRNPGVTSSRN